MQKRLIAVISLLLFSLVSFNTLAQAGSIAQGVMRADFYVSGFMGLSIPENSSTSDSLLPNISLDFGFEPDVTYGAAIGASGKHFRAEIELSHQANSVDKVGVLGVPVPIPGSGVTGDFSSLTTLFNVYYDLDLGFGLRPYLTGGVGFANVDASTVITGVGSFNSDDTVIAFQAGAGVGYAFSNSIILDARYRYFNATGLEFETVSSEFKSHNLLLGLRIDF